jgi:hypothetical protein
MTKIELDALRHPSEASRFRLSLLVVVPILITAVVLAFASFGIALVVVAAIVASVWFVTRLASAIYLGNFVKVSPDNFPEIDAAVAEYKQLFGYGGQIDVYIYENGSFNAFVVPLLRRKCILINSEVVANAQSDNEVRWIVARFIGSLASKHYRFSWLQTMIGSIEKIMMFNMLLYPYERAVVKSGDQLALHAIDGDLASALRASQKFMVGGPLGDRVNLSGLLRQHEAIRGSFFGWLAQCMSPFPHTTTRVVNLVRFASRRYPLQLRALLASQDDATLALVQRVAGTVAEAGPFASATPVRPAA